MNQWRFATTVVTGLLLLTGVAGCGPETEVSLSPQAADGETVARQAGCLVCHSSDGSPGTGPTFAGLYQSQVQLNDGSTVTADEDYIRDSILQPDTDVVDGFSPLMPKDFADRLSGDEIDLLVAYITELK